MIIPFHPAINDENFMGNLYRWVVGDPAYATVFRESFTDWQSFFRFFDPLLHPGRVLLTIVDKTGGEAEFAGMYWFDAHGTMAWANFLFKKKYWGKPLTVEGSELCLRYMFKVGVRVIIGVIPEGNRRAINFGVNRLSFTELGTIPELEGKGVGGTILYRVGGD